MPGLWICHGSEFASGSGYSTVLNMPRLHTALNKPE